HNEPKEASPRKSSEKPSSSPNAMTN
ncbi:hypothetical protein D046_2562B, partial [Vibrio parahaemolyticus V-223/04]